jgi:hypothetical protein
MAPGLGTLFPAKACCQPSPSARTPFNTAHMGDAVPFAVGRDGSKGPKATGPKRYDRLSFAVCTLALVYPV